MVFVDTPAVWLYRFVLVVLISASGLAHAQDTVQPDTTRTALPDITHTAPPDTARVAPPDTTHVAPSDSVPTPMIVPEIYTTCRVISELAFNEVPVLFYFGDTDSLFNLLDNWSDACGPAEPILRTAILGAIWEDSFSETMYDESIIDHLAWSLEKHRRTYVAPYDSPESPFYEVASPVEDMPGIAGFDSFTSDLADQLLPHTGAGSLPELFCLHYAGRGGLFERLRLGEYAGTDLQSYYDTEVASLRNWASVRWSAYLGYWIPHGGLSRLGNHPAVGASFGWRRRPVLARLVGEIRFLESRDVYWVDLGDEVVPTSDYASGYIGIELGLTPVTVGRFALDVFGGVGLEGIQYIADSDYWLNSLNLSAGMDGRIFLDDFYESFLTLDVRHEWTYFDAGERGSDLSGGAWNVRIGYGQVIDRKAARKLRALGREPAGF